MGVSGFPTWTRYVSGHVWSPPREGGFPGLEEGACCQILNQGQLHSFPRQKRKCFQGRLSPGKGDFQKATMALDLWGLPGPDLQPQAIQLVKGSCCC